MFTVEEDTALTRIVDSHSSPNFVDWTAVARSVPRRESELRARYNLLKRFRGLENVALVPGSMDQVASSAMTLAISDFRTAPSKGGADHAESKYEVKADAGAAAAQTEVDATKGNGKSKVKGGKGKGKAEAKAVSGAAAEHDDDIVIHVHDEARKLKKDFKCKRSMLVKGMKYFEGYLTDASSYEEIDISVHCDLHIFQWLVNYMTHPVDDRPVLDVNNLVSVLISSDFLQMDQLVTECMDFFKRHVNSIVTGLVDLSCLHDKLLQRFADMFTVEELEHITDPKRKIVDRSFSIKVQDLMRQRENCLHQCALCSQIFAERNHALLTCPNAVPFIGRNGDVQARHQPNLAWDSKKYLVSQRVKQLSWQSIYWQLFGVLNVMKCLTCGSVFQLSAYEQCAFHGREALFAKTDPSDSSGVYPCCKAPSRPFEPLLPARGCRTRRHTPEDSDSPLMKSLLTHLSDICPASSRSTVLSDAARTQGADAYEFEHASLDRSLQWATVEPLYGEASEEWDLDYAMALSNPTGSERHNADVGAESEDDESDYGSIGSRDARRDSASGGRRAMRMGSGRLGTAGAIYGGTTRPITIMPGRVSRVRAGSASAERPERKKRSMRGDNLRHDDYSRMATLIEKLQKLRASTSPKRGAK